MIRLMTWLGGVGLMAAVLLVAAPGEAQDSGTVGLGVGMLAMRDHGSTELRPTLRAEASLRLAGPLYGGAYLQGTGERLPLANAQVAGGLTITLRAALPSTSLKLYATVEAGRISLPSSTQGSVGGWNVTGVLGVDVPLIEDMLWLDLRAGYMVLFGLDSPTVSDRAWSAGAGVTVPLI